MKTRNIADYLLIFISSIVFGGILGFHYVIIESYNWTFNPILTIQTQTENDEYKGAIMKYYIYTLGHDKLDDIYIQHLKKEKDDDFYLFVLREASNNKRCKLIPHLEKLIKSRYKNEYLNMYKKLVKDCEKQN